jgi:YidC/Oxa1 family membrane protein insertase
VEKRFALFLILSALILFTHLTVQNFLHPPQADQPPAEVVEGGEDQAEPKPEPAKEGPEAVAAKLDKPPAQAAAKQLAEAAGAELAKDEPTAVASPRVAVPQQWVTLGSMASDSPYRLMVTLQNTGAAVERIEMVQRTGNGQFRFLDLEQDSGYLGYLALEDTADGKGCRVNVVGPGTPAAGAKAQDPAAGEGLRAGDVIRRIDSLTVRDAIDLKRYLAGTKPGQTVQIAVVRAAAEGVRPQEEILTATLAAPPLSIVRPDGQFEPAAETADSRSFLFTLESIGDTSIRRGAEEIDTEKLPSLRDGNWEVRMLPDDPLGPAVEFTFVLSEADLKAVGTEGSLELVKRYRLAKTPPADLANSAFPSYHLQLELEIRNRGAAPQQLAYRLDGPSGLPLEGWWYVTKIHPKMFAAAGTRDVVWNTPTTGHGLIGATQIYSDAVEALEKNQPVTIPLFADPSPQPLEYVGVDAQYFSVVVTPQAGEPASPLLFKQALAVPVGNVEAIDKALGKTADVSFRLISQTHDIPAGEALVQRYTIFAGPKQPALLTAYQLERVIEYGWFRTIAKALSWILHMFESLPLVNYGLAIILLTVLVRSCMIPLSRKAALNAQMMQELAPEMKRIAEKYKDDMQKRAAAQSELFKKHNYRPLGGCLLMFVQLPIFIGLYRALSVDVELRQAPLIPGLDWCSNLAGPDMLWYWKPYLPAMLAGENGWLGPYFNVLPIVTIVLFLWQQKMFMPPATDEQTRMQQSMMKYMMIFMGLLFFRVPSGLCIYFIASSLWSIAERKLLPPVGKPSENNTPPLWQRVAAKFNPELDPAKTKAMRRQRRK